MKNYNKITIKLVYINTIHPMSFDHFIDLAFTCENVVLALREKGHVVTESTIDVKKNDVDFVINSFTIPRPGGGSIKIYDRGQYATDLPNIGMFIDSRGMCYGDHGGNSRAYCIDDILKHLQ
jgi:hypothetical protein